MKKNLTVNQLALGNLKIRKKQYILLIVGIILSIAFSASILFFYTASQASTEERRLNRMGEQQFIIFDADNVDFSPFYQVEPELQFTYVKNAAFVYLDEDERAYGMTVGIGNEAFRTMSRQRLSSGRMPETIGEIAVEAAALSRMQLDVELGESFTVFSEIPDGNGGVYETKEQTFTLVGILTDKCRSLRSSGGSSREEYSVYNDYPAAYLADTATVEPGGKACTLAYGKGVRKTGQIMMDIYNQLAPEDQPTCRYHAFYDGYYVNEDIGTDNSLYMLSLLGIILVVGSCFGIVTAFNMNLQERKRQIGLLRAVGATKKQILNIFGREALIIALCSVPVGLLISYLSVFAIIRALGDGFVFRPAWYVLILGALLGITVVMLAAMIPLLGAARISPMQALRNTDIGVKMKRKKIKMKTEFRAPDLIASREIRLRGAKQSGIAVFIALGILLSTLGTSLLAEEFEDDYSNETDVYINAVYGYVYGWVNVKDDSQFFTQNEKLRVLANPYVKDVFTAGLTMVCVDAGEPTSYMLTAATQHALDYKDLYTEYDASSHFAPDPDDLVILPEMRQFLDLVGLPDGILQFPLMIVDDEALEALVEEADNADVTMAEIHAGEKVVMIAPEGYWMKEHPGGGWTSASVTPHTAQENLKNADKVVYKDAFFVGDTIKMHWLSGPLEFENYVGTDEFRHVICEPEIGACVSSYQMQAMEPYHSHGLYSDTGILTTERGAKAMGIDVAIRSIDVNLIDNSDVDAQKNVNAMLREIGSRVEQYYLFSNYEFAQQLKQDRVEVLILLFALLMLFFCISAATLCNTTNARIRESRRVIGTLRAVGASAADLRKTYLLQYVWVFGIGGAIGFGGTLLYKIGVTVLEKLTGMTYSVHDITWWVAFLFVGALLAVCLLNLVVRLRRETKNSIVDNIREL